MNPIQTSYINALLADSSYVEGITSGELSAEAFSRRMTPAQANYLAANFRVLDSVQSPNGGFDAVVWQVKEGSELANTNSGYGGKVFVSMRGTQGGQDILDDISLATRGLPHQQIADMVNWWLQATASPSNAYVPQIRVFESGNILTENSFVFDRFTTGTGKLSGVSAIESVNGHSLGGYLSTAFTRLFGANVQSVYTFNSAGFSNVAAANIRSSYDQVSQIINGASLGRGNFDAIRRIQTNYYGENGINVTTNSLGDLRLPGFNQYGARTGLYQESVLSDEKDAPITNHFMYKLTDYLALGTALEKLDSTFNFVKFNELVKAGSNDMKASYESVLDALRKALAGPNVEPLPTGDVSNSTEPRPQYHATLTALQANPIFSQLAGQVKVELSSKALGDLARKDFAAFVALRDLSPVTITGTTPAAKALLTQIWLISRATDYAAWQADQTTSPGVNFTDSWIKDRTAMLDKLMERNTKDINDGATTSGVNGKNVNFEDVKSSTKFIAADLLSTNTPGKYLFGSEQADTSLLGLAGEDRLYGGAGDDTINGQAGVAILGTTLPIGHRTSAASNTKAEPTNGMQGKADCENTMNSGAACARNTSVLATFMGRKRACRHSKHALNAKSQSISNSKSANLIEQHHA